MQPTNQHYVYQQPQQAAYPQPNTVYRTETVQQQASRQLTSGFRGIVNGVNKFLQPQYVFMFCWLFDGIIIVNYNNNNNNRARVQIVKQPQPQHPQQPQPQYQQPQPQYQQAYHQGQPAQAYHQGQLAQAYHPQPVAGGAPQAGNPYFQNASAPPMSQSAYSPNAGYAAPAPPPARVGQTVPSPQPSAPPPPQ